jgi:urease accessory protein
MPAPKNSTVPTCAPQAAGEPTPGWQASLDLTFEQRSGVTVLAECRHHGPLIVQRPFYPEDEVCHVYVVHPPGGVVAGDQLALSARVRPRAHALITTPAAGKFYRSTGSTAFLRQDLTVESGTLEWLPQENIFFPGASVQMATCVQLLAGARFFGWEISCFGLSAGNQPFESGEVSQHLDLRVDAKWLLCERQVLDREAIFATWGLAGNAAVGTLVVYPAGEHELAQARGAPGAQVTVGASLVDGVLVCRAIAQRADRLREAFVAVWRAVRPLMPGRKATLPRVWAT